MGSIVNFTKMHGAGNDYIYVDTSRYDIPEPAELARRWSDRHTGIGSDGLVLIGRSTVPGADFTMRIFNADGSEARMCGNASRCIAKYVHDHNLSHNNPINLETLSGIKVLSLNMAGDNVKSVTVDMGEPSLNKDDIPVVNDDGERCMIEKSVVTPYGEYNVTAVSMGNPHKECCDSVWRI